MQQDQGAQPSPELFFTTINAYQRTAALQAAVELDLFTAIAEGATTADAIARACGAAKRGIRILCDYLVIIGFLVKDGNNYVLTPDSAVFLDRRSEAYLGSTVRFLLSPMLVDGFKDLATAVRKGGTVLGDHGTMAPEHPIWVEFARSMAPLASLPAVTIARMLDLDRNKKYKVLDIAAGHGKYGIAIARAYPEVEIVALDWPAVLEVARENARAAGVESRFSTIGGSAFDADFGSGYRIVLLTNFLHHFDPETCEHLLRKVHASLERDGRAVTVDFVLNEDRISPPLAAAFSLMMLGSTKSGDAYTFSEFDRMFRNAGFRRSELRTLPAALQSVVVSEH